LWSRAARTATCCRTWAGIRRSFSTIPSPDTELAERVQARGLPVRVDLLRPPTFDRLQARLRQRPGFYHIVHFDGHGGYGEGAFTGSPHLYGGVEGRPIFETEAGGGAPAAGFRRSHGQPRQSAGP
jgi:hypothetical protein